MFRRTALVAGLVAALALATATTANATTFVQRHTPFSGLRVNSCAGGELIAVDGYFHTVLAGQLDAAGNLHLVTASNSHRLAGVGLTSGDRYVLVSADHSITNVQFDPAPPDEEMFAATRTSTLNFVSAGSGDNFKLVVTEHFTFLHGELISLVLETRSTCSG